MKIKLILGACLLSFTGLSQIPAQLEEYLEEKVRDSRVRAYIENHVEAYQEAKNNGISYQPEGPSIEEFVESIDFSLHKKETADRDFSLIPGAEPFIAMNPANRDHLVVSYMSSVDADYPIYVTFDGGVNWTPSSFSSLAYLDTLSPGTQVFGGGDPVLAFDANGNLHMTYIYVHGSGFNFVGGMYYVNSTDGGITFNIPSNGDHIVHEGDILASDLLDRQWMHCDTTGGSFDGTLYMSAVYFGGSFGTAGELVLRKLPSDGGFTSYAVAAPHNNGLSTQFGNLKVDGNGHVHMACMEIDGNDGSGNVLYTKSTDNGTTFSTPTVIAAATTALPNGGNHIVHGRDNSSTSMAVDGNNVYITWTDMANSDVRAYYSYSNDAGATFSTPVQFGLNTVGSGYYHLMPNVAADNGKMSLTWYAVDSVSFETQYVMAESQNAGQSFSGYAAIGSGPTDFMNENAQDFYGDYNASEKNDCFTYSVFTDGRTGSPVVYFVRKNGCVMSVDEISAINSGIIVQDLYPNPASNQINLNIESKTNLTMKLEVFDMQGRVVKEEELNAIKGLQNKSLNLDSMEAGKYFIRISNSQEFKVLSFIVE